MPETSEPKREAPLIDVDRVQRPARLVLIALIVLVPSSRTAWSQRDTGSIVGTVIDPSGAVVPQAHVTLIDVDRGTAFVTFTSNSGEYVASPLKIGRYTVTVERKGLGVGEQRDREHT